SAPAPARPLVHLPSCRQVSRSVWAGARPGVEWAGIRCIYFLEFDGCPWLAWRRGRCGPSAYRVSIGDLTPAVLQPRIEGLRATRPMNASAAEPKQGDTVVADLMSA